MNLGPHDVTADGHEMSCRSVDGVRCLVASALPARRHPFDFHAQARYFFFQTFFPLQFFLYSTRQAGLTALLTNQPWHLSPQARENANLLIERAEGLSELLVRVQPKHDVAETPPSPSPFVRSCSPFAHLVSD